MRGGIRPRLSAPAENVPRRPLISGLAFSAAGATGSGALATSSSGRISTIDTSHGSFTTGVADALTRWKTAGSGTSINLTTFTGGKPNRLIIGPDDEGNLEPTLGGTYSNANPSIYQHNPNVPGTARFGITVSGVTSTSDIRDVVFRFGTSTDTTQSSN